MKALIRAVLISVSLAAPALAFAQAADAPVSRAEVRADLVRVEQAGYRPSANNLNYPTDIQNAEAKVAAESGSVADTSVGGVAMDGSSQTGALNAANSGRSLYAHH